MIGIYKITSPSNKIYIGQSVNIEERFKQYKYLKCKGQTILYRSFLKYGVNEHIFEILEECNINEINNRERFYQDLFNCVSVNGLNCQLTNTNNLKRVFSEQTKSKMSISAKKKVFTKEHLEKITFSLVENNKKKVGIPLKESTKLKLRLANIGTTCVKRQGFNHFNSKIVLDNETGIFYGSAKLASIAKNINYSTLKDKLIGRRNIKNNTSLIYV